MPARLSLLRCSLTAVFYDVICLVLAAGAASSEVQHLIGLCVAIALVGYLEVNHKRRFSTTHRTGTVLHALLRNLGFDAILRLGGVSDMARSSPLAYAALAWGLPLAHALLSYFSGVYILRLDERGRPPSTLECAIGLGASHAFVAASLMSVL